MMGYVLRGVGLIAFPINVRQFDQGVYEKSLAAVPRYVFCR